MGRSFIPNATMSFRERQEFLHKLLLQVMSLQSLLVLGTPGRVYVPSLPIYQYRPV